MLKKILSGILLFIIASIVAVWLFWPANWTVSGPILAFITGEQAPAPTEDTLAKRLALPDGFHINVFAENVPHARMMAVSPEGDVAVSSMREGNVILLQRDSDNDGVSDGRTTLLSGLDIPHGVAFHGGYIYVAETHRIVRAVYDSATRKAGAVESVFEGLPPGGNHRTRTIGFGPDDWLYVTVGSTCNVCIEDHPYRAAMLKMRPDGSDSTIYATGLRNTVGFDWQPETGRLFGTDNGRDLLGDDIPNCEINLIEEGQFYGWPYTFDMKVTDPDFGAGREEEIARSRVMAHGLGGHVAPLGIRFLQNVSGYEGTALVALHGSWNRSVLSGYKVVALHFDENGLITETDFLTGFEKGGDVIGRPVDIVEGPEGAIYISDDYSGTIYRVDQGEYSTTSSVKEEAVNMSGPFDGITPDELTGLVTGGSQLYTENSCGECHNPAEAAEGVQVKVLKDLNSRYSIDGLMSVLDIPPGPMPRPDITDEDRKALAVFLLAQENAN